MGVQFAGNILVQANGGPLPISQGGTGQTTAPTAINALLPTQAGQSGKYLKSDGTNVSWVSSSGGTPGGSDTQIQYNDSGTFGGNAFLTINKSTGAVTSTSTLKSVGLFVSDIAGSFRTLHYQTAGSDRWLVQANNTTESGSNTGSDFELVRVADNGATQNVAFSVARSSGVVDFKATPTINGTPIGSGAGTVTSVNVSGGTTGLTATGGPITSSGTITLAGTLALANGGTGATTQSGAANAVLPTQISQSGKYLTTNGSTVSWASVPAAGVTSVAMTVPTFLSVSGSPITTTGTLAITLSGTALPLANGGTGATTQAGAANAVLPTQTSNSGKYLTTDGTNASWATVSGSGTVTSVAVSSANAAISVSGSPVTSSGTITITPNTFTAANPGVVPASGGGTTTFLRADGTWATGTSSSNALTTNQVAYGIAGVIGSSTLMTFTPGSTSTPSVHSFGNDSNRGIKIQTTTATGGTTAAGQPDLSLVAGNGLSGSSQSGNVLIQSGTAASTTDGAIIFTTGVGGTTTEKLRITPAGAWGLSGAANVGTAGQILISNAAAAPTWTSTFTGVLGLTGAAASTAGATNITAGVNSSNAFISLNNSTSGSQGLHSTQIYADGSGTFHMGFWNDTATTTDFLTATRTAGQFQTPQVITLTSAVSISLSTPLVSTSGYFTTTSSITGASSGSLYAPVTATNFSSVGLKAPSAVNSAGSSGVSIGASSSDSSSQIQMYDSGATTGSRGFRMINWGNGANPAQFFMQFMDNDCVSNGNTFFSATRTSGANTPVAITLTAPTVTASAALVATTSISSPTHTSTGTVTLTTGGTGNALTINTPAGANTGAISIIPGTSSTATVGSVTVTGGATSATSQTGGAVSITGGAGTGTTAVGGAVSITGGAGTQTGGAINITAANSTANPGGAVTIKGGNTGTSGIGGDIVVTPGAGSGGNPAGAVTLGVGSLAQAAAGGFPYMPLITVTLSGTPSGSPTAKSGFVPFAFDSTNNKLWIWNGSAWKGIALT